MPITLRSTKGTPLTHTELDGNFLYIQDHSNLENLLDITSHPQYTLTADMTRYSVTSHTHSYLPLSGGTVTGDTVINAELLADRVYVYSEEDATEYPFEIATWAQTSLPYEISMVLHNYSDSQGFRIDQVGDGHHITLNNTHNETRRPGVTGSGDFIRCYQTNASTEQLWGLSSNSNMIWYGDTNEVAKLIQNKTDDSTFGFSIECNNDNQYHTQFKNAGRQLIYLKEGSSNNSVDLYSGGSMTNGMRIGTTNGNLLFDPAGNVGIGTSNPLYNLHVEGSGVTRFLVKSADDDQASFDLWGGGNFIRWITDDDYATRLYRQSGSPGDLFTINYDGDVTLLSGDMIANSFSANGALVTNVQGLSAGSVMKHIGAGGFHKSDNGFFAAMAISGFPRQSVMYNIKISGYDYRYEGGIYTGTWDCSIGIYWVESLGYWKNPTVTINGYAPFDSVSGVVDADNNPVLILGTTATPWRYTSFEIDVYSFYDEITNPLSLETWALSNVNLENIFHSISGATPAIYVDPTRDNRTTFKGNLVHSGDQWIVGTTDWNPLTLTTNGLSRMTITEGGNVGIGITNPGSHRLTLSAVTNNATPALSIRNQTADGDTSINLINTEQTMTLGIDNDDRGKFKISDYHQLGTDDRFVIDKNGNVGINTSSPRSTFHVSGATNQNGLVSILNFEDPTDGWYNFKLKTGIPWDTSNTNFQTFMSKIIIDGWYYHSSIKLEIGSYVYENYWYNPSVQCLTRRSFSCPTVTGAVENGFVVFQFSASPVGAYGTFQLSMIEGDDAEDYDYTQFAFVDEVLAATAEMVQELPYKGWNQNDTLYIRDGLNANVGIGTSAAEAKLHICEDMNNRAMSVRDTYAATIIEDQDARLQLASNNDGTYGSAIIMTTSSHSWSMWQTTSLDDYKFYIGYKDSGTNTTQDIPGGSARYFTFANNGWLGLGIADAAPEAKLHIKESDSNDTLQLYLENTGVGDTGIKMENSYNAFSMGIDGSSFKISDHTALGTNDRFMIDNDGNTVIKNSLGVCIQPTSAFTATISGDVLIMGSTGGSYGSPRLSLRGETDKPNESEGPSIELLEGDYDFGTSGSNGFRWIYDGNSNFLKLQSTHDYVPHILPDPVVTTIMSIDRITPRVVFTNSISANNNRVQEINGGSSRPASPVEYEMFFDTSLTPPRPIWYHGAGLGWVDATGASV